MTISNTTVSILKKILVLMIYLPFVIGGGWMCRSIVIAPIVENQGAITKQRQLVEEIKKAPTSDYFLYASTRTTKLEYKLGESPEIFSDRKILAAYPYGGTDVLYCDKYDGSGFGETSITKRDNISATITTISDEIVKRERQGLLPTNPRSVYVPARCYINSKIAMNVEGVYKSQTIVSNLFEFIK